MVEKLFYSVIILRQDGQHITAVDAIEDYESCTKIWSDLQKEWADSWKEQRPFVLLDPVVTAFNPSLIFEIKLFAVAVEQSQVRSNNPYQKKMMQQGFSNTFPNGSSIDVLSVK